MNQQIALPGSDNRGTTFLSDGRIFRRINPNYVEQARELLATYRDSDLVALGVVPTGLAKASPDMVLEHRRYEIVHPHEWSSLALKEAALFHLRLSQQLHPLGLTLKDALPDNILFELGRPRFVDFLSIVQTERLADEGWLSAPAREGAELRRAVLRRMFTSHFLIPLLAFSVNRPALARAMLRTQACGMDQKKPSLQQLILVCPPQKLPWLGLFLLRYFAALRLPFPQCYERLAELVTQVPLRNRHGYARYYDDKGENFDLADMSGWREKQVSVQRCLEHFERGKLLDIGANTGWFSRLGLSMGYTVTSYEIDESSINVLHERTLGQPLNAVRCPWGAIEVGIGQDGSSTLGKGQFYSAPVARHRADVTLVLGLIHHLALGENRSFDEIFRTLANTCRQGAVLEFIDFDDALIAGNPRYFPSIAKWDADSYAIEPALIAAKEYFNVREVLPSHPATRSIVLLEKRKD